jgi:transcriptional regulator with XRE-family HTH domain
MPDKNNHNAFNMQRLSTTHQKNTLARLAKSIATKRRAASLTQAQLAELLAVEPDTISRMERGLAVPSLERLLDFANALNTTVNDLLGDVPKEATKTEVEWTELLNELSASDKQLVLNLVTPLVQRFKRRH